MNTAHLLDCWYKIQVFNIVAGLYPYMSYRPRNLHAHVADLSKSATWTLSRPTAHCTQFMAPFSAENDTQSVVTCAFGCRGTPNYVSQANLSYGFPDEGGLSVHLHD